MHYLILLFGDEATGAEPGDPRFDAEMDAYVAFGELAGEAILGGEALQPTTTARTIRHDGGRVAVTDGPFAEVSEALGGFYVLDVPTLDDAIELVRHLPPSLTGACEIRPVAELLELGDRPEPEGTARYLVTIHGTETDADLPGTPAWATGAAEHGRFGEEAGDVLLGGAAIHPTTTASVVRVRDGELLVTDGPYTEGIEVVGGYYLLRGTPEQVEALAALVPVPADGGVEIRPIMEMDG